MRLITTNLPEVLLLEPKIFRDQRGFFLESFNQPRFAENGLPTLFLQDNHSRSYRHVLRGLHYQLRRPQGKLVTVIRGRAFDVAVDIRVGSPTFAKWFGVELHEDRPTYLWIPPGFAHGFCALSESVDLLYKCTDVYVPDDDHGIIWSDPTIGIDWPIDNPLLSRKDECYSVLNDLRHDLPVYHD